MSKTSLPLSSEDIASALEEIGARLEFQGESPFKTRAYYKAVDTLEELETPLEEIIENKKLTSLKGIGKALAEKIETLHKTGTHPTLEKLRSEVPDGLFELRKVPTLGPAKILKLQTEYGITDLTSLEKAIQAGKLDDAKGIGKQLEKISAGIQFLKQTGQSRLLVEAEYALAEAGENLKDVFNAKSVEHAGDVRRGFPTIEKLSIAAVPTNKTDLPKSIELDVGRKRNSPKREKVSVRVLPATKDTLGAVLVWNSCAQEHKKELIQIAEDKNLNWTSEGLLKDKKPVKTPDENSFYKALDLPLIPAELRNGTEEIQSAKQNKLPELIKESDIRGQIHNHTTWSDGGNTLQEMAEATRRGGWDYLGVCDHSQSDGQANGLDPERIRQQWQAIDELNKEYKDEGHKFIVLKGTESYIHPDGSLDFDDDLLEKFDLVVVSIHSHFNLTEKDQTKRMIKAVSHPNAHILGHPTGRLLLRRQPYKFDMKAVLEACAEHNTIVEVNAAPERLDLDWQYHRLGKEVGCKFAVNRDAHSAEALLHLSSGIASARRGGLTKDDVVNCLSANDLLKVLHK